MFAVFKVENYYVKLKRKVFKSALLVGEGVQGQGSSSEGIKVEEDDGRDSLLEEMMEPVAAHLQILQEEGETQAGKCCLRLGCYVTLSRQKTKGTHRQVG